MLARAASVHCIASKLGTMDPAHLLGRCQVVDPIGNLINCRRHVQLNPL